MGILLEAFQEMVVFIPEMIGNECLQIDVLDTAEDVHIHRRIGSTELLEQGLDLLPLGTAAAIVTHGAILGKPAGALDKL